MFELVIVFLSGLIIGSFLNALAFRYGTGLSMWGRSQCTSCGKTLSSSELVPVLSYLAQLGKCRGCKVRISAQYPFVELLAGFLAVVAWVLSAGSFTFFVLGLGFFSLLLFISLYDLKHTIIPDAYVYTAAGLGFLFSLFQIAAGVRMPMDLLVGPALALPLAALWVYSDGKWIGLGDAKLMLAVGWFLGTTQGVAAFLLSFWIGALVSVGLLLWSALYRKKGKRVTMETEVPFGPFIAGASLLVYATGVDIFTLINAFSIF